MISKEWKEYIKLCKQRPYDFKNKGDFKIIFDYNIIKKYELNFKKKAGVIYSSDYNILVVDLVKDISGNIFFYERIIPKVEQGAIVAFTVYKKKIILLKQFRHSLREVQYSFPRGFGELNISQEDNLIKEIYEEIGGNVINYQFLGNIIPDSGLSKNKVSSFFCEVDKINLNNKHEGIKKIICISREKFEELIFQNNINDGFSLSTYSLFCIKEQKGLIKKVNLC